jgi:hypothetical protein
MGEPHTLLCGPLAAAEFSRRIDSLRDLFHFVFGYREP